MYYLTIQAARQCSGYSESVGESEQQIMYLRYWEKYNLKEIAELIK
ncbi:MAG: sigma factor-like helix-turn-helix DNA-binding protein [Christensenellaceae bacterium]